MKLTHIFLMATLVYASVFAQYSVERINPGLDFENPRVLLVQSGEFFIASQNGIIYTVSSSNYSDKASIVIDLRKKVWSGGDDGLLGFTLHPRYSSNGKMYVSYTTNNPRRLVISEFVVKSGRASNSDEKILIEIPLVLNGNRGGVLAFGNDGFLYIATGDGGGTGDPSGNAQDKTSLLGKVLRIDINSAGGKLNYLIPSTNPYRGSGEYREEIFAIGLRNPQDISPDPATGRLYLSDRGQRKREEVNIIAAGRNYGWRIMEGSTTALGGRVDNEKLTNPVYEYAHSGSYGFMISGGVVYRGGLFKQLNSKYVFADYGSSRIMAISIGSSGDTQVETLVENAEISPISLTTDAKGDIYILDYNGGIYKLSPFAKKVVPELADVNEEESKRKDSPNTNDSSDNGEANKKKSTKDSSKDSSKDSTNVKAEKGNNSPTKLIAGMLQPGVINLSWKDNNDHELGYIIERKSGSSNFKVLDTVRANNEVYEDYSVADTTLYTYRVRVFGADSLRQDWSNTASIMTKQAEAITSLKIFGDDESVTVRWTTGGKYDKKGFIIQRSVGGDWVQVGSVKGNTKYTYEFKHTYRDAFKGVVYYRVVQKDAANNEIVSDPLRYEADITPGMPIVIKAILGFVGGVFILLLLYLLVFKKKQEQEIDV